jgi:hypothetical protein
MKECCEGIKFVLFLMEAASEMMKREMMSRTERHWRESSSLRMMIVVYVSFTLIYVISLMLLHVLHVLNEKMWDVRINVKV